MQSVLCGSSSLLGLMLKIFGSIQLCIYNFQNVKTISDTWTCGTRVPQNSFNLLTVVNTQFK